ncbi:hypothetical protein KLP28_17090 [Nocardioidaceae bacterium]|nr:hypothetical protein KLP28_17090 [Nocardioidaceae bacterium]
MSSALRERLRNPALPAFVFFMLACNIATLLWVEAIIPVAALVLVPWTVLSVLVGLLLPRQPHEDLRKKLGLVYGFGGLVLLAGVLRALTA